MAHPSDTFDPSLLLAHSSWLRSLARSLVGDPHRAEDLIQEAWVAALQNPPVDAAPPAQKAWLRTVLQRRVRSWHESDRSRHRREAATARRDIAPAADEVDERIELHRALADAIAGLAEKDRQVVVMRYFEDMPPREIARRLGIRSGAVRTRLSRALSVLRARMDRQYGGRRAWIVPMMAVGWPTSAAAAATASSFPLGRVATVATVGLLAAATWMARPEAEPRDSGTVSSRTELTSAQGRPAIDPPPTESPRQRLVADDPRTTNLRVVDAWNGEPLADVRVSTARLSSRESLRRAESASRRAQLEQLLVHARDPAAIRHATDHFRARSRSFDAVPAFWIEDERSLAVTSTQGTVEIPRQLDRSLHLSRPDYTRVAVTPIEGRPPNTLALARSGRLEIAVLGQQGEPLKGIHLRVRAHADDERLVYLCEDLPGGVGYGPSTATGIVVVDGVPCGTVIEVQALDLDAPAITTVIDPRRRNQRVTLVAGGAGELVGQLVGQWQLPPQVEFRSVAQTQGSAHRALAQDDGNFRLTHLPRGEGVLRIVERRRDEVVTRSLHPPIELRIEPSQSHDLGALHLVDLSELRGEVTDWRGPVEFWQDRLLLRRTDGRLDAETTIGPTNQFLLRAAPGSYTLELQRDGQPLFAREVTIPGPRLALSINPHVATLVARLPQQTEEQGIHIHTLRPHVDGFAVRGTTHRASEGTLRMSLAPGSQALLAFVAEEGAAWIPNLDLRAGESLDLGRLALGWGSVSGRVLALEKPAEVLLRSPIEGLDAYRELRTHTDAAGRFSFGRVAPGPWQALVRNTEGPISGPTPGEVHAGQPTRLTLREGETTRIRVRLTDNSEPIAGRRVDVRSATQPQRTIFTDQSGRATLDGLAPGPTTLAFRHRQHRVRLPITLSRRVTRVEWSAPEPHRPTCRVPGLDLAVAQHVEARLLEHDSLPPGSTGWASTDGAGRLTVSTTHGRALCALWGRLDGEPLRRHLVAVEFSAEGIPLARRWTGRVEVSMRPGATPPHRVSIAALQGTRLGIDLAPPIARGNLVVYEGVPPGAEVEIEGFVAHRGMVVRRVQSRSPEPTRTSWPPTP